MNEFVHPTQVSLTIFKPNYYLYIVLRIFTRKVKPWNQSNHKLTPCKISQGEVLKYVTECKIKIKRFHSIAKIFFKAHITHLYIKKIFERIGLKCSGLKLRIRRT